MTSIKINVLPPLGKVNVHSIHTLYLLKASMYLLLLASINVINTGNVIILERTLEQPPLRIYKVSAVSSARQYKHDHGRVHVVLATGDKLSLYYIVD